MTKLEAALQEIVDRNRHRLCKVYTGHGVFDSPICSMCDGLKFDLTAQVMTGERVECRLCVGTGRILRADPNQDGA